MGMFPPSRKVLSPPPPPLPTRMPRCCSVAVARQATDHGHAASLLFGPCMGVVWVRFYEMGNMYTSNFQDWAGLLYYYNK